MKKKIHQDFQIQYNQKLNKFYLINPIKNKKVCVNNNTKKTISMDPGIRTFMMGYSNKKCIDICSNLKKKINKYLIKINKVKEKTKCIKKKVHKHYYKKIKNVINDMHWKVIKYLTKNFNNILIGNMSTKQIVKNRVGNYLHSKTKQLALLMRLGVFKQRLKYKSSIFNIGYREVDEAYTSKTCSQCGYENKKNGKKIFKCEFCKYKIDRDINGARNIMINGESIANIEQKTQLIRTLKSLKPKRKRNK